MRYHLLFMHSRKAGVARILGFIGLAMYVAFLVVAPFEHHDFACELKTPQHCTSCAFSQLGSDPGTPVAPDLCALTDAGSAVLVQVLALDTLLAVRSTGRSPPAFA
jgi:hypothetical protein